MVDLTSHAPAVGELDPLTRLRTRSSFQEETAAVLAARRAGDGHVAVLMLDLHGFGTVNDSLGHRLGDQMLRATAARIAEGLRQDDLVSRVGSDEFAALLLDLDTDRHRAEQNATDIARRLISALGVPFELDGRPICVSASIGLALNSGTGPRSLQTYPAPAVVCDQLLRHADLALYAAKAAGPAEVRVFEPRMDAEAHRTLLLDGELRAATARGELAIHLQPRVRVSDGSLTGAEALLRWPQLRTDPVDTASAVAVAEGNGLIIPVGRWVLGEALRVAGDLLDEGVLTDDMTIGVNISGQQMARDGFVEELAELLDGSRVPPSSLTLELTESALMADLFGARQILVRLAELGVRRSIDDFGTGYSSLAYLRDLPVDELKLDRIFITDLGRDPVAESIVQGVVDIATRLGITVVAEGVERAEQLEFLASTGCTHYQGFLASPAISPAEFTERYRDG